MTRRNHPIDELVTAIQYEIAAILAGNGSDGETIALRDGKPIGTHDAGYDYVFSVRNWRAPASEGFLVRPSNSRGEWARATGSIMLDGKLRLTTATALGRNPANVQLRADDTVLLELLAERIEVASERTDFFNKTAASWTLGDGSPKIGRCAETGRLVRGYERLGLNERQRLAIEHALASDITFIWGPPGTGKTDVVSRIIEGCYRQGLRVLFVAPTHYAVDQALERVCELLEDEDQFPTGLVQRAGDIAVPSLAKRYGSAIKADDIVARLSAELTKMAESITQQLATIRAGVELHQQIVATALELRDLINREEQLVHAISNANSSAIRAEQAARDATARLNRLGTASGMFRARKQETIRLLHFDVERHQAAAADFRACQRRSKSDPLVPP